MYLAFLDMQQIVVIIVVIMVVFGPHRIPELSKAVGRAMREFRKAMNELQEQLEQNVEPEGPRPAPKPGADEERKAIESVPMATIVEAPPAGTSVSADAVTAAEADQKQAAEITKTASQGGTVPPPSTDRQS